MSNTQWHPTREINGTMHYKRLVGHIPVEEEYVSHNSGEFKDNYWGVRIPAGKHPVYQCKAGTRSYLTVHHVGCTLEYASDWSELDNPKSMYYVGIGKPYRDGGKLCGYGLPHIIFLDSLVTEFHQTLPNNPYSNYIVIDGEKVGS